MNGLPAIVMTPLVPRGLEAGRLRLPAVVEMSPEADIVVAPEIAPDVNVTPPIVVLLILVTTVSEVMSEFAPEAAAPRLVSASGAVDAPVPPLTIDKTP